MKTRTIQKTGKLLKLQLAISVLAILAGVFWWVAAKVDPTIDASRGVVFLVGGIAYYLILKVLIWWNHG